MLIHIISSAAKFFEADTEDEDKWATRATYIVCQLILY